MRKRRLERLRRRRRKRPQGINYVVQKTSKLKILQGEVTGIQQAWGKEEKQIKHKRKQGGRESHRRDKL